MAENLDILLGFVSRPYFTAATVEKEQGIIGQEIKQYDDAPDWRLMFAMYECLYTRAPGAGRHRGQCGEHRADHA